MLSWGAKPCPEWLIQITLLHTPKVPPICTEGPAVAAACQRHPTWTSALKSHSPSLLHMTAFLEQGSPAGAQTSSRASPGISLEMQTRTPLPRPTESEPVRGRLCFKKPSGDDSDAAGVRTPLPIAIGRKVFTRWARLCAHSQQLVQWSAQNICWAPKRGSPYLLLIGESNPWCVASEGLPTLRLNPLSFLMGCVFHIHKSAPPKSSPGFFLHSFQLRKSRTRWRVSTGVCFLQGEGRFCRVLQFPSASLQLIF